MPRRSDRLGVAVAVLRSHARRRLGMTLIALALCACAPVGSGLGGGPAADATPGIGDAARGKALFTGKGCHGCHRISGEVAGSSTGPDLKGLASRPTLAGTLPNNPENLWWFIQNPQRMKPGTAMPRMPLAGPEIDDLVAYLETLK
jgi:cytochrome c2